MMLDSNIIIFLVEAIVLFIVFFIFYNVRKKTFKQEIFLLQKRLDSGKKRGFEKEVNSEKVPTSNNTSFIQSELIKREGLEKEIERLKSKIENTKSIAQEASMVKTDFLANIRHEIRTPLNSILVFSELLRKEIEDKRLNSFANNIDNSGRKLLLLMDNIIELSSIESGSFEINEYAVDTNDFFNSIVEVYQYDISKKGLSFSLKVDDKLPSSIMIDNERVKEIVENLLSNAIKFTEHGFIKLDIELLSLDNSSNTIEIAISVEDSGIGISEDNQTKIFEIFEKKDNCSDIEFEGTGLGLSINRKLAHLMGGKLEVQSEVSKGSVFTLTLRDVEIVLQKTDEGISAKDVDFGLIKPGGGTGLVVDNTTDTLNIMEKSFKNSQVDVVIYDNARGAIEFLLTKKVDLIFIDIDMLVIDDGAVSQVINSISKAPVVTLTSSRLKGIDFGHSGIKPAGHLKKPISEVALFEISLKILNSQSIAIRKELQQQETDNSMDKQVLKAFLSDNEEISTLYIQANKTNDFNIITNFAQKVLELSQKHQIVELSDFASLLLEKIELFEIDHINEMLKEYDLKIKRYKSLIKE